MSFQRKLHLTCNANEVILRTAHRTHFFKAVVLSQTKGGDSHPRASRVRVSHKYRRYRGEGRRPQTLWCQLRLWHRKESGPGDDTSWVVGVASGDTEIVLSLHHCTPGIRKLEDLNTSPKYLTISNILRYLQDWRK